MLAGQNKFVWESEPNDWANHQDKKYKPYNNCKTDFDDQQKIAFKTEKLHLLGPCEAYMYM